MTSAALAVLQLDTRFPRLPGDIASPDTYLLPVRLQTIAGADVDAVVTHTPQAFDLTAFEQAVEAASEPLLTTSCGFMIYFQDHLSRLSRAPFVSSALTALPSLRARYPDEEILIVTFDAATLTSPAYAACLDGFSGPVAGLAESSHLYQTIKQDHDQMDAGRARAELAQLFSQQLACQPQIKAVLLECTNLSPYKVVFRADFDGELVDALTLLERQSPGLVKPEFLI